MLKVIIPPNSVEVEYTIDVLLKYIMGVPYKLTVSNQKNVAIKLDAGGELILPSLLTNLKDSNYDKIFGEVNNFIVTNNEFLKDQMLPLLFGTDQIQFAGNSIICNIDILSACFFMLTRVEEVLSPSTDNEGRQTAMSSHAYNNNYLHRPVVNEYAEMLWNILLRLGVDENLRKKSEYKIIPTHDIDKVYYKRLQFFLGDIIIDKNISRAVKRISLPKQNYWDTFSWMMDVSEENNLQSIFYMMADSDNKLDSKYSLSDSFIKSKIDEIKSRGHKIGIHPGYGTIDNFEEWNKQKELLENSIGQKIEETRQHFLRFNFPETINIIEKAGVKVDSTLSYPDQIGFRCGTSSEFPLFDLVNRRVTNVIERPLIIMDIILRDRKNTEASAEKAIETFESYKETCKKYQIPLTILFHNSSFDPIRWNTWKEAYRDHFLK